MEREYTLSILKPDALAKNIIGKVNSYIENSGLIIVAQKMMNITESQAADFYFEHKNRSYFSSLIEFMTSGPVVVQVLCGNDAVKHYREVMGATNPADAKEGTIRRDFADSIEANVVHGSDSLENAEREISFFFAKTEIFSRD